MISVDLEYTAFHGDRDYGRERCVWTRKTDYQFYPLSYSLQDCLELLCERLGWEYEQYKIYDRENGILYAMKPEPKPEPKRSLIDCWNGTNFSDCSADSTDTHYYVDLG